MSNIESSPAPSEKIPDDVAEKIRQCAAELQKQRGDFSFDEDEEYFIITRGEGKSATKLKIHKMRFIPLKHDDGTITAHPLEEVVEAEMRFPETGTSMKQKLEKLYALKSKKS